MSRNALTWCRTRSRQPNWRWRTGPLHGRRLRMALTDGALTDVTRERDQACHRRQMPAAAIRAHHHIPRCVPGASAGSRQKRAR
jgi:hypothetical protein